MLLRETVTPVGSTFFNDCRIVFAVVFVCGGGGGGADCVIVVDLLTFRLVGAAETGCLLAAAVIVLLVAGGTGGLIGFFVSFLIEAVDFEAVGWDSFLDVVASSPLVSLVVGNVSDGKLA